MPVVLDNDAGERVLLYGADGSTLRKVVVDSSGRLVVVGPGAGGASVVTATNLDIRDLVKTLDELYAVLRTDGGTAYDAREMYGRIAGAWQRQPLVIGYSAIYSEQITVVGVAGTTSVVGTAVGANTLRILTAVSVVNLTRAITRGQFRLTSSSSVRLRDSAGVAGGIWDIWLGYVPIEAAAAVVIDVAGTLAGDDVRGQFQGWDMALTL